MDSDAKLIRRIAEHDTEALRVLYVRHGPGVLAYLVGRLDDPWLAEEVLQDVMLDVWNGAPGFRGESKVRTWILTIAHHRAHDARRRRQIDRVPLDPYVRATEDRSTTPPEAYAEYADVLAALEDLPTEQRATLELVCGYELTMLDAAAVMGVAAGTVKSRLHRARAALRRALQRGSRHVRDS